MKEVSAAKILQNQQCGRFGFCSENIFIDFSSPKYDGAARVLHRHGWPFVLLVHIAFQTVGFTLFLKLLQPFAVDLDAAGVGLRQGVLLEDKLVLARHRENGALEESHFDEKYIEALVNEFKGEEFIDMDTKYFDKQNIRLKAEDVGEKNLYGLYYDYDSSFEHGLWGAIRESSLLKCNNPAHKYHRVPDVEDETRLKTVLPDCIMIMNKTISFLDEIYGIPEQLLNEVINFEIKPIAG